MKQNLIFLLLILVPLIVNATESEFKLDSGNAINVSILPADGAIKLLWLPSEHGLRSGSRRTALALAEKGVEIALADLFGSYFLPPQASSIKSIPVEDIKELFNKYKKKNNKQTFLLASGRTAVLALQAVKSMPHIAGIILISPNLYVATPEPGREAQYLPVVDTTKQSIVILQPQLSPWYWWKDKQAQRLIKAGSWVNTRVLAGVRDRFYFRPDAMPQENSLANELPGLIIKAIGELNEYKIRKPD